MSKRQTKNAAFNAGRIGGRIDREDRKNQHSWYTQVKPGLPFAANREKESHNLPPVDLEQSTMIPEELEKRFYDFLAMQRKLAFEHNQ